MRKIKLGDTVKIINGKDKGKTGEVVKVFPKTSKIVVKGINIVTKHEKQSGKHKGGLVKVENPISISKAVFVDMGSGKSTRVKFEVDKETGKKYRISVKSGKKLTEK
jgi:large subunit ribosomal protein L24